ncbi:MAG: hypothetical protein QGH45_13965, partial [Myxococcota bacterium]|nr:hypothetical protein [Myxococcota bacterium]
TAPGVQYGEDIALVGDYAYIADKIEGVKVFNCAQVAGPFQVAHLTDFDEAWDLVADGDTVYVADKQFGLRVIDASQPGSPVMAGDEPTSDGYYVSGIAVDGDTVYLGGGSGNEGRLTVIDVSGTPTTIGDYTLGTEAFLSMAVDGGYLVTGGGHGTLQIWDTSTLGDGAFPVGQLYNAGQPNFEPWGLGVTVHDSVVYYADWGAGLIVVDITLPNVPVEASVIFNTYSFYDTAVAEQLTVMGTTYSVVAVAANSSNGVLLIDASDPYAATPIGSPIDVDVNWDATLHGVSVRGPYAYLADNGGDHLFKIARIAD